jgi:hypothetical protein
MTRRTKAVTALPRHDIDDRALDIAELGGRSCRLHVHFLNEVDARLRRRPLHGQVKFVPSIRNAFSLVPEPNTETLLLATLPGVVGDTPGAARIASNMLKRRIGMDSTASRPNRVSNPLFRASSCEPEPCTTSDSRTNSCGSAPPHRR